MIVCKSPAELEVLHRANQIVRRVLDETVELVVPGATTGDLDEFAESRVRSLGGEPAFKGYRGFPATLCVSLNEEIVHGIPTQARKIAPGDVVSIDLGVRLEGMHGDSATTVAVPPVDPEIERLLRVTEESLYAAIEAESSRATTAGMERARASRSSASTSGSLRTGKSISAMTVVC